MLFKLYFYEGTRGSAIMYSVVETAKENNLSPYHSLRYLFETLPNINLNNYEERYVLDSLFIGLSYGGTLVLCYNPEILTYLGGPIDFS